MPRLRTLAFHFVLAVVIPGIALAQSDSRRWPPAVVVDSFLAATRDARWLDAARFVDLDAIASMRDRSVRAARRQRPPNRITPEMILEHDPKMPREVAEYQARQANDRSTEFDALPYEYAAVPSVDSLARLPRADVAARWLEAQDPRWGMRRGLLEYQKRGCIPADSIDAMVRGMRPGIARILGTVIDDSLAYVLHERAFIEDELPAPERARSRRGRSSSPIMMPPSVTMLRRVDSAWRIIPAYEPGGGSAFVSVTKCPPS